MNRELEAKNFEAWARKRGMNPQRKPEGETLEHAVIT